MKKEISIDKPVLIIVGLVTVSLVVLGLFFNVSIPDKPIQSFQVVQSSYQKCVDNGDYRDYVQPQYAPYSNLDSYYCDSLKENREPN